MFDFICALAALGNAFVQVLTVKAVNQQQEEEKEEKPKEENKNSREGVFTYRDAYAPKDKASTGYQHLYAKKSGAKMPEEKKTVDTDAEKNTSAEEWCSENMDILLELTKSETYLIPNDVLGNVDVNALSETLFRSINSITSIDVVEDGLKVMMR